MSLSRREAREQAFVLLFEKNFFDEPLSEIIDRAVEARELQRDEFAERLAGGAIQHMEEIDQTVESFLKGWHKNRISKVAISLLRLAAYEMLFEENIPVSVSINEAVELAKKFGGQEDASFINGVLGGIAKSLPEEQK